MRDLIYRGLVTILGLLGLIASIIIMLQGGCLHIFWGILVLILSFGVLWSVRDAREGDDYDSY